MVQGQGWPSWPEGHIKERRNVLGRDAKCPRLLMGPALLTHRLWVSKGEASHFWELCRREGQPLECRAISSIWVGSLPPMCPLPPVLGTPRHPRDETSFPGLIQLPVSTLSEGTINNECSLLSRLALLRKPNPTAGLGSNL